MDRAIPKKKVPRTFRKRVKDILANVNLGKEEEERFWGTTPFDQFFVIILTLEITGILIRKTKCFRVTLILEEDHWGYREIRCQEAQPNDILEQKDFHDYKKALDYRIEKLGKLSTGDFDDNFAFRIRAVPDGFLTRPDDYILPGDHIQRFLIEPLGKIVKAGNHEGIYLGDGLVAHISTENKTNKLITQIFSKKKACARIDTLEDFLEKPNVGLRIVAHCYRRRYKDDIVIIARFLADDQHQAENYNLLMQNCQHFATLCVRGREIMTDRDLLIKFGVKAATVLIIPVLLAL